MAGTVQSAAFLFQDHVAVTAKCRVARPLVTRKEDEAAGLVELTGEVVEVSPELLGDLEVVALVAHGIHKGQVAGIFSKAARAVGADRLFRLPVHVAQKDRYPNS